MEGLRLLLLNGISNATTIIAMMERQRRESLTQLVRTLPSMNGLIRHQKDQTWHSLRDTHLLG